ncbi:Putative sodium-dependent multivitamin transporter [Trachymyrmex cornetzi]|uniref:Putative sodium-dependent multivitamin transporter n=1 Tax=Trachymyrmex cornetzi TaxID=471704 RepID=A0A195DFZ3_9HYME|nr:Putative sodium-dependent multivitamin transporter [Trachymyrmex cornetzi]
MEEINTLGWVDYLVIAIMLCISAGIGVYYRFSGGRQKTMEEYFVASRSMSIIPVAVALVVSFMSAVTLLGVSAENYTYGTQFVVINLSYLLGTPIVCYGFLPVFFKLQATSAYEYLEKRFGIRARMMASFVYFFQLLLYSGVVLYAPSLALEATTGISKTASIVIIGLVCAFYSTIGGIKAVLITDVFQGLLMFAAVFLIIGTAANGVGGLGQIWEIAKQGQRLEFDSIELDPTVRHTWWSLTLGGLCTFLSLYGVNQVQIQRMLTVKNMKASQKALWLSWPILSLLSITTCFSGLAIYSKYHNCDPFLKKRITSPDMLMPLYVMDTVSNIPGLPGIFVAGIFSAGLSTISAAQNSLAAVTLEDYMKPLYKKCVGHEFSPTKSAFIAKVLAFTFGIISIALAFLAQFLGGLLQASLTIFGVVGGPLLGVFTLGMGTESATESGAIIGALTAFSFLFWIVFGQPRPIPPKLPTTIEGCDNVANITISTGDSSYFYLYRISYMWYSPLGFLITFILGLVISNLSHLFFKKQNEELDTNLFFPVLARRIYYRRCMDVENERNSSLNRKYSLTDVIHGKDDAADKIYGTQFWMTCLSFIFVVPITSRLYLPVFIKLRLTSSYEYLQLRFDRNCRLLSSALYMLQMVLYTSVAVYAPALALSHVTGLNTYVAVTLVYMVCIFYASQGGMKAVIMTDTFQAAVLIGSLFLILGYGLSWEGGIASVWEENAKSGRMEFFNMDPSPTVRHSFWSVVIGGTFYWTTMFCSNQASVQKYLSVENISQVRIALWVSAFGMIVIYSVNFLTGMVLYSAYKDCDPLTAGYISGQDQILPLYVMNFLGGLRGMPGFFVAGIFAASLGTVASALNSLAAITCEDILRGLFQMDLPASKGAIYARWISIFFGALSFALVFIVERLGSVLQVALSFNGMVGGVTLGLFSLGMFVPWANAKGAIVGAITSLVVVLWIGLGAQIAAVNGQIQLDSKPISIAGCPCINETTIVLDQFEHNFDDEVSSIYKTSYLWYSAIGCMLTMLVGLAVSFATGAQNPADIDQDFLSPPIAAMFRIQTKPCVSTNVQGIANFGLEMEDEKPR